MSEMIEIRIPSSEAHQRIRKLILALSPGERHRLNRQASIRLHADVIRTFAAQGQTEGRSRWKPLKAGGRYTGTGTRRRFQTVYQLLQDTGALRQSWIPLADEAQTGVGASSGKAHADLAVVHQFGVPSRNLPARPMLPTEEHALGVVTRIYGLAVERASAA